MVLMLFSNSANGIYHFPSPFNGCKTGREEILVHIGCLHKTIPQGIQRSLITQG